MKQDVFNLIEVPVRHQEWTGWPQPAEDETVSVSGWKRGVGRVRHQEWTGWPQPAEDETVSGKGEWGESDIMNGHGGRNLQG